MFAKALRFPIRIDHKQILWPTGHNKTLSTNKTQLEETTDLLEKGHMIYRYLTDDEEVQFRAHARTNYKPFTPIEGVWHPVYQDECVRINHELSFYRKPQEEETNALNEV